VGTVVWLLTISKSGRLLLLSLLLAFLLMRLINEVCLHYQTTRCFSKLVWHCIWTMHHTVLPKTYDLIGSYFIRLYQHTSEQCNVC